MSTESRRSRPFADVLYGRRAIRAYQPDLVTDEQVRDLLDAAVHAPTAMHQEPWQFVIVQNRATLKRLSDRAKAIAAADARHQDLVKPPGAADHGVASPLTNPDFNIFYDAGTLIVICAKPSNDFVVADCWLAAENLMLDAFANGLGTCCIGFAVAVLNTPEAKTELGIPADVRAFAPIIVGVPRGEPGQVARRAAVELSWLR